MSDDELEARVQALRAQGRTPREIAHALGVRPATVATLVRAIAVRGAVAAPEPAVVGCWVSPGWRAGLTVEGHADWPDGEEKEDTDTAPEGLVSVLVARAHRYGKVSACGYLTDVWCLGVKDTLGPRVVAETELPGFLELYYQGYAPAPVAVPIELARQLVWGAIGYARELGFEPAADFDSVSAHLGPMAEPGAIKFGRDGRPVFVQGPNDDAASILETLGRTVGEGNFELVVRAAPEARQTASQAARQGPRAAGTRGFGDAPTRGRMWRNRNR
jgi:hypothetical protein